MNRRLLWTALLGTLGASAWMAAHEPEAADVVAVQRPQSRESARAAAPPGSVSWPPPPQARSSEPWAFEAGQGLAWSVPAPPPAPAPVAVAPVPPAVVAEPVEPVAPAFPYVLVGRVEDGPVVHALFSGPTQSLSVKALDVIDGQWRVDSVDSRGVSLTWLPGGSRQTLAFRSS